MARWLVQNLGTLLLAVIMAVMTWVVALQTVDPIVSQEWALPVRLDVTPEPPNTIRISSLPEQVTLTLRGPQSALARLSPADLSAYVDLGAVSTGTPTLVCVVAEVKARGVMLDPARDPDPACVSVHLELHGVRTLPIEVRVDGGPARGYQLGTPRLLTPTVTLEGPAPYLDRVSGVYARLGVEDVRAPVTQVVTLAPLDAQGQLVTGIDLTPDKVQVVLPVTQLEEVKELVVSVDWLGAVAPGYALQSISVDPLTVLVTGSPEAIRNLPAYVLTSPIDISNARQTFIRRAALELPAGITLVDEQSVLVEVAIEPLDGSATITRTVELQGLGAGLQADVSPPSVAVILSGPAAVLSALTGDDLRVVVDVFGLGPGTYTFAPRAVILPENVQARTLLPATVQISLSVAPSPTPVETATPTPTPPAR